MRVLFWGTPAFAVPSLRALTEEGHDLVGVVTRPDRPAGRGREPRPSPVKQEALSEAVPVLEPAKPTGPGFAADVRALDPELNVVVAYGHILDEEILGLPLRGSVNVHASLLPELRGAAPIHWAIARGYERTGVTVMRMVEAMDAGPVLLQVEEPIGFQETSTELAARLSEIGAQALLETLAHLEFGTLEGREQDHERATYAPKVDRVAARIVWSRPTRQVYDHVRAMDAVPGAWSILKGESLKLFRPRLEPREGRGEAGRAAPSAAGEIVDVDPSDGLGVRCGDDVLWLDEVQPAGGRRMRAEAWLRGHPLEAGLRFA